MNNYINKIHNGDSLKILKQLPDNCVDCVVTSPPYWYLRDYGIEGQLGLEPTFQEYINNLCNIFDEIKRVLKKEGTCWVNLGTTYAGNNQGKTNNKVATYLKETDKAWLAALIDGEGCLQIHKQVRKNSVPSYQADISVGMKDRQMIEKAHKITGLGVVGLQNRGVWDWSIRGQQAGYLAQLVYPYSVIKKSQVRVLVALCKNTKKENGKTNGKTTKPENINYREKLFILNKRLNQREKVEDKLPEPEPIVNIVPEKCDLQIPSRFAIEMCERGWILRNEIIWAKPNCMPHSVKDRFTVDFEKIFFFTKSKKYYFEQQFEPLEEITKIRYKSMWKGKTDRNYIHGNQNNFNKYMNMTQDEIDSIPGRNKRCVWKIPTKSYPEAHFAVYPEKLIETPILAGSPELACKKCGKPKEKILEPTEEYAQFLGKGWHDHKDDLGQGWSQKKTRKVHDIKGIERYKQKGYKTCKCNAGFTRGIVLDPFMGSGTTAYVARKYNRNYIGIELNPEYISLAKERLKQRTLNEFVDKF